MIYLGNENGSNQLDLLITKLKFLEGTKCSNSEYIINQNGLIVVTINMKSAVF